MIIVIIIYGNFRTHQPNMANPIQLNRTIIVWYNDVTLSIMSLKRYDYLKFYITIFVYKIAIVMSFSANQSAQPSLWISVAQFILMPIVLKRNKQRRNCAGIDMVKVSL